MTARQERQYDGSHTYKNIYRTWINIWFQWWEYWWWEKTACFWMNAGHPLVADTSVQYSCAVPRWKHAKQDRALSNTSLFNEMGFTTCLHLNSQGRFESVTFGMNINVPGSCVYSMQKLSSLNHNLKTKRKRSTSARCTNAKQTFPCTHFPSKINASCTYKIWILGCSWYKPGLLSTKYRGDPAIFYCTSSCTLPRNSY